MFEFLQSPASIRLFGVLGGVIPLAASLIAGLVYRGKDGRRYSPFNHFISELGEAGVSRLAAVFNGGLIACGLLLLPCCVGLGLFIPGTWSKLAMAAGVLAALAVSLVGVFPMNNLKPHTFAAMSYFRLGMGMVILFTLAILLQPEEPPVIPRLLGLVGVPAIFFYAFFLVYAQVKLKEANETLDPSVQKERPHFWLFPTIEWAIFLTTVPWFLAIALTL
jgi:hypothetical membrane protein